MERIVHIFEPLARPRNAIATNRAYDSTHHIVVNLLARVDPLQVHGICFVVCSKVGRTFEAGLRCMSVVEVCTVIMALPPHSGFGADVRNMCCTRSLMLTLLSPSM